MPAEDICILDHNSRDGSTDPQNLPVGVHVRQIHGDETFSPMDFMNRQVDLQIHRLLMAGYRCVFFTEVDEIVTADPEVYPGGLAEYFRQFLANSSVDVVQVTGCQLAHVSEGSVELEPPIDMTQPILQQRNFWYNKPVSFPVPNRNIVYLI